MKKAIEFVVYSNVWVASAVAALCGLTMLLINAENHNVILFAFFSTLLMYAYARWFVSPAREDEVTSKLTDWKSDHKLFYIISGLVGGAGSLYYALELSKSSLVVIMICAGISALYPVQFLQKGQLALRNVAGLKLFVISLVWAIVTVVLPAVESGLPWSLELVILTFQRFLFVMAITIPFDIRDLRIDHPDITTLPYKIGVKASRSLARLALLFAEASVVLLFFTNHLSLPILIAQLIVFEFTSLLIHRSTPNKSDLYFSFGIESTSILLFLMVYIFNYFWP